MNLYNIDITGVQEYIKGKRYENKTDREVIDIIDTYKANEISTKDIKLNGMVYPLNKRHNIRIMEVKRRVIGISPISNGWVADAWGMINAMNN